MKRTTKIAAVLGLALGAAFAGTTVQAHPEGYGPGMRGGMGMGMGMGYGMGRGMGPGMGMGPGACVDETACPGMGPGNGRGPGYGRGYGPGGNATPGAFLENRLSGLKSELKITGAQEGAWNAYADEAKKQAEAMVKLHETMRESTAATQPERMELRNQMWKAREARHDALTTKTKELYAALTPEQRSIADRRLGGFGPGMGGGPRFGRN